ncbi:hypothetical protein ILYODFUR_037162, partial [Ilyodon furcidens]
GIHGVWVRGHMFDIWVLVGGGPVEKFMLGFIGGRGLMTLGSEFISRSGLFHPLVALVGGPVWPCRPLFCTCCPLWMRMDVVGDWGQDGVSVCRPGSLRFRSQPRFGWWGGLPVSTHGGKGTTSWVRGVVAPMGYRPPGPESIEYVWGV